MIVKNQALQVSIHTAISATNLVALICDKTLDNPKYEKVKKHILKIHKDATEFNKKLISLELEYQKNETKKVSKDNLKKAINISLDVRKVSQSIEKVGFRLTKIGDKSMQAEARTAIHLSHAASKSALESIKQFKKIIGTSSK